ncbi:MAG: c-type cytochrome [Trueperaceae bacterium]|nr:c-type cytochrome [Trueperaceae bacterium]
MDHDQHEVIAKWERRWLSASGLMSLTFVIFIAINLALEGTHIAQTTSRTTPDVLGSHELFANPGVTALGPGKFQVAATAQAFSFTPSEIRLPVGAEVDFYLTSKDVLHGFQIENTNINVETIPGEISYLKYTFDKPGEYRLSCNEYCGISHQNMLGKIVVLSSAEFAQDAANREAEAQAMAEGGNAGEAVFAANCVSCHQTTGQGMAGVFPPLAGHLPSVYNVDGGRDYLIDTLLYGLQGQIQVDGAGYNGVMPAWAQLSDQNIADVLNYALTAWGNDAALTDFVEYTPEDIAAKRGESRTANDNYELRQSLGLE